MPDLGAGLLGCYRCAYVWRLRKSPVRLCPRCKSALWDSPRTARPGSRRPKRGAGPDEVFGPRRDALLKLVRSFGATDPRVFGSVARGEAGPGSDVDLLVTFANPPGLFARMDFREKLEELLGRRVDLATEENLHWLIRPRVMAEAIPV
jgi:predicted nucleotidyltransferase